LKRLEHKFNGPTTSSVPTTVNSCLSCAAQPIVKQRERLSFEEGQTSSLQHDMSSPADTWCPLLLHLRPRCSPLDVWGISGNQAEPRRTAERTFSRAFEGGGFDRALTRFNVTRVVAAFRIGGSIASSGL
jgi:hypothetical protein